MLQVWESMDGGTTSEQKHVRGDEQIRVQLVQIPPGSSASFVATRFPVEPCWALGRAGKTFHVLLHRDLSPKVIQQRAEGIILRDTKGEHCFHEDTLSKV